MDRVSFKTPLLGETGNDDYGTEEGRLLHKTSVSSRFKELIGKYKQEAKRYYLKDFDDAQDHAQEAEYYASRDASDPKVLDQLRDLAKIPNLPDNELAEAIREIHAHQCQIAVNPRIEVVADEFPWPLDGPMTQTDRRQYLRSRNLTITSQPPVPVTIDAATDNTITLWSHVYLASVVLMICLRMLYHFDPQDNYLGCCIAGYLLVLCSGIATIWTPVFNNVNPTLLKDFVKNVNVIVLLTFVAIYLSQIALFAYNPLLNDDVNHTFQFLTALIEILVLFHGLLLDVLYYVPSCFKSAILITNFCVIIFMAIVMYLDDSERPVVIPPEFRYIDLYTGTLTAIMIMYAGSLFNHFIRQDGRTAIITRHVVLLDPPGLNDPGLYWMWVPVWFLAIYASLTAFSFSEDNVPMRIVVICILPFILYFCILRDNLDLKYLPAPFDRADMCSMALVPIIHIVLGFIKRTENLAYSLDHIIEMMGVYIWLCIDLIERKSDLWVFAVTVFAFGYITFEVTCTLLLWDHHDAVVVAQIGGYKLSRGHMERSLYLAFWILGLRGKFLFEDGMRSYAQIALGEGPPLCKISVKVFYKRVL